MRPPEFGGKESLNAASSALRNGSPKERSGMNHKDQGGGVAATWAVHRRPREGARTTGFDGGGGTKANEEARRNVLASRGTKEETRSKSQALPGGVKECGAPGESGAVIKKVLGT